MIAGLRVKGKTLTRCDCSQQMRRVTGRLVGLSNKVGNWVLQLSNIGFKGASFVYMSYRRLGRMAALGRNQDTNITI